MFDPFDDYKEMAKELTPAAIDALLIIALAVVLIAALGEIGGAP